MPLHSTFIIIIFKTKQKRKKIINKKRRKKKMFYTRIFCSHNEVINLQVTKSEKYVKAEDVKGKNIMFKFLDEPLEVDGKYGPKLETRVRMSSPNGETAIAKYGFNNTSKDHCIDKFGPQTLDWVDKEVSAMVEGISGKDCIILYP